MLLTWKDKKIYDCVCKNVENVSFDAEIHIETTELETFMYYF